MNGDYWNRRFAETYEQLQTQKAGTEAMRLEMLKALTDCRAVMVENDLLRDEVADVAKCAEHWKQKWLSQKAEDHKLCNRLLESQKSNDHWAKKFADLMSLLERCGFVANLDHGYIAHKEQRFHPED